LACPAFDKADVLALEMLTKLLSPLRWDIDVVRSEALTAEVVDRAVESGVSVICIGSVAPGGLAHTRYLCKRLRAQLPDVKIIEGRWGRKDNEENEQQLLEAGADAVATTLLATRNQLTSWAPVLAATDEPEGKGPVGTAASGTTRPELAAV